MGNKGLDPQSYPDVPCNICGANDAKTLFPAGLAQLNRVVQCRNCGLMYSSPRLQAVDHELVEHHNPALTGDPLAYNPTRFAKEQMQVRDYDSTRKFLARRFPNRGKLIEIGCGMGFLLKAFAEDGWTVTGIEPDRGFCQFIEREHQLNALPTILEESGLPSASADVVVFLHVIEHVPDPLNCLKSIHKVLKPGGILVVETPRYDSLMFRIFRHRERSVRCDGHIYFFTTDTLRKLTALAGFRQVETRYVGRTIDFARLTWNLSLMIPNRTARNIIDKFCHLFGLSKTRITVNARDMQRVILEKELA